ncbi:uncharacterized protein SPSK_10819 [Sporothrix schenckii 1099-18]|uniref:Uncharacterized protein n=1 Tax=Sporothrix schenckii 1099-18 TaxID=1397361 RepID=A0A0F2MFE6_SPOSC|nr:uncharacterized protein SPSK_10819 [Sporothrix schenckii 1099-18]KJR88357.1 hypothetical protein SPSK_10819 [Sporothrix schenckii 1099-18]
MPSGKKQRHNGLFRPLKAGKLQENVYCYAGLIYLVKLGLGLYAWEGKSDAKDGRRGGRKWPIRERRSCTQAPKAVADVDFWGSVTANRQRD